MHRRAWQCGITTKLTGSGAVAPMSEFSAVLGCTNHRIISMNERLTKASDCIGFAVEDLREAYKYAVDTGDNFAAEYLLLVIEQAEKTRNMVETARNAANG